MTLKKNLLLVVLCFAIVFISTFSTSQDTVSKNSPAFTRAQHLKHGINLSEWFAQVYDKRGYTKEHFETWNTSDDMALIKSMGFDHIRLSANPEPMMNVREPQKLPPGARCRDPVRHRERPSR